LTTTAYIGLGSNIGDGKITLQAAWQNLGEREGIVLEALSRPYMSAPVDMTSQHWFTNAVGKLQTTLSPQELLQELLLVEKAFGRKRDERSFGYQDRSLDLDLLYYGDVTMDQPELVLPHPRIGDRLFVLVPLAELAGDFRDPVSGLTVAAMEINLRERLRQSNGKQELIPGVWRD
jgi:2-amino-4-hydroxy-6-hydroxymethyldihydropteridine diphosphokinase